MPVIPLCETTVIWTPKATTTCTASHLATASLQRIGEPLGVFARLTELEGGSERVRDGGAHQRPHYP